MKTGFIGAGKVGFTLGKYFKENGDFVTGYFSRNPDSAKEAAAFTGTKCFRSYEQISEESDILFLTVPDSAIKDVWDSLKTMPMHGKIICHCSGALPSGVFDGIDGKGAYGYSVHPFFAVNSKLNSYKEISEAFFTIEGNEKYLYELKEFIERLGNPVHIITAEYKIKYHTAAVFLSNHVTALADIGVNLLKECGFDEEISAVALKTLFLNHSKAIAENGTVKALTGSVERNDVSTVKKHIDCLDGNEKYLYMLLSGNLIEISKQKHTGYDYSAMELMIEKEMGIQIEKYSYNF